MWGVGGSVPTNVQCSLRVAVSACFFPLVLILCDNPLYELTF